MQLVTLWTAHPYITFIYNWAHVGLWSLAWYFTFVSDKKDSTETYFLSDCDIEMHTSVISFKACQIPEGLYIANDTLSFIISSLQTIRLKGA